MAKSLNHWNPPTFGTGMFSVWYRNYKVWFKIIAAALLMHIIEPLLYLVGLGYGLGFFIQEMDNMPYLTFLASGIIASSAMNTATFEGMYSVFTRMVPQRTYEAFLATPITIDDIVAGEMLWCATKALMSSTAILLVAFILGAVNDWQALLALPVIFIAGFTFTAPAMIMVAFAKGYDFFSFYFTLVVTPMFLLSGVFYPVSSLPEAVQTLVYLLPLTHAVELTRPLIAGQPVDNVAVHLSVLIAYAVVGYYFAVVLIRKRLMV